MTAAVPLRIDQWWRDGVTVVVPSGVLDLASYARLRDTLIKCALEVPRAIVVDVESLHVPTPATLAVFPTVWMRVSDFPGVPVLIVTPYPEDRERLVRAGIARYVPVHASVAEAIRALDTPWPRRRAVIDLTDVLTASFDARRFVGDKCSSWGCGDQLVADAAVVATALVENAVRHAGGEPSLRLELRRRLLTVAVHDDGPMFALPGRAGSDVRLGLGLMLVDGLARAWGCAGSPSGGKVVWAVLHPPDHTV